MSLNAMEDDNNNNNNDDKALIVTKNTDWIPGAAYCIEHRHYKMRKIMGEKWQKCRRYYPRNQFMVVKADKCFDFGNVDLQLYPFVAFYDVNKNFISEHLARAPEKFIEKEFFKLAQSKLDPNVKLQVIGGVVNTSIPPMLLELHDKYGQIIFGCEDLHLQLPLHAKIKEEIGKFVDVTQLRDENVKTDWQKEADKRKQKKAEKERKKALKKEKK